MESPPVFFPVGYLFLLRSRALGRFQASGDAARARPRGRMLSPAQALAMVPELDVADVLGATFCPTDGLGHPHEVTQAYVTHARRLGVRFEFGRSATGLRVDRDRVTGVHTAQGELATR